MTGQIACIKGVIPRNIRHILRWVEEKIIPEEKNTWNMRPVRI